MAFMAEGRARADAGGQQEVRPAGVAAAGAFCPSPPPLASSSWHPPTPCPLTLLVHSS